MRIAIAVCCALAACGGKAVFRLSSDENNAHALKEALARRTLPSAPAPVNAAGSPRVYAVAGGARKQIAAYDLARGALLWQVDAPDVRSRIAAGGDFIVALEGARLVARDQARGAVRWAADVPGDFVGLAADRERAYVVYRAGAVHWLAGYDGAAGRALWKADAVGALGAPAAHGGVVYVPFLRQWLSIVDGATGKQLTRLRGIDEEIATLRTTSRDAFYGSARGVFVLDARSAAGARADATYGQVAIPPQLERASYAPDAYDLAHQTYSAADRSRVLWTAEPVARGPMKLAGDRYAIHYFRFVLGYGGDGALRWAYSHPGVELVASEHTGAAIAAISSAGEVVALDPETGAVRARRGLGVTGPVTGATFDADGWAPPAASEPPDSAAALASIARDRDARFDRVKDLAVAALAKLPSADVVRELVAILIDDRAPPPLKARVAELLVERRDPHGLPALTEQLAVRADFLADTAPRALAAIARAVAALGGQPLDAEAVTPALAALQAQLEAPTAAPAELAQIIAALAAIGRGAAREALASHLTLYRADDLADDPAWQQAIVPALAGTDRELLRRVAADARTKAGLTRAIRDALGD